MRAAVQTLFALGVVAVSSIGCFTTTTLEAAQTRAATMSDKSCKPQVRERRDVFTDSDSTSAFEIAGCGLDVLVSCTPGHWETYTNADGSLTKSPVGAACHDTNWCTPDGCDSFELAVRNAFSTSKACPVNRVTAANHERVAPTPPPEVAADAERLALWKQVHDAQTAGHYFFSATGCGTDAIYDCQKPAGVRTIPVCVPSTAAP